MANFFSSSPAQGAMNNAQNKNPFMSLKPKGGIGSMNLQPFPSWHTDQGNWLRSKPQPQQPVQPQQQPQPVQQVPKPQPTTVGNPWASVPKPTGGVMQNFPQSPQPAQPQGNPYANFQMGIAQQQKDLASAYAPRVAAPYGRMDFGGYQQKMSDYERRNLDTQLAGLGAASTTGQGLLSASLPQSIGPTDYAYDPLQGAGAANQGAGSAFDRVSRAGALGAAQTLGGQQVSQQADIGTIQNVQGTLNGLFTGYTNFGLVPLNEWKNKINALTSSGQLAALQTTLAGAAAQLPDGDIKNQLQQASGNLANSSPAAIKSALDAAIAYKQAQQSGAQSAISGGVPQGGGQSTDGYAEAW